MIKKVSPLSFLLIVLLSLIMFSCENDPTETCGYDVICDAKEVTSCCTDDVCVYKYNGKEYSEDELDQLVIDLGCSTAIGLKSTDGDNLAIKEQLISLLEGVRQEQLKK